MKLPEPVKLEEKESGFRKIRGLFFMFLNILFMAGLYILQKVLMADSLARGNPINPNEMTYFVSIILMVMFLTKMYFHGDNFFPMPKNVRVTYIIRCLVGSTCNLTFLFSLQYISFAKASVIFWTSPVFTAVMAHYVLHERLSIYDWLALFIAFLGILLIQNPF